MKKNYVELLDNIYSNLPKKVKEDVRIEIPKFSVFSEGNKTIIKNFSAVCEALRRSQKTLVKFFTKELAAPVSLQGDRAVINRRVGQELLNKKLDEFVKEYVKCQECGKIDTHLTTIGRTKELICEACGARRPVV